MRKKIIILFIFISQFANSQGFAAQVGYANIGTNYGYAGLDYRATKETHLNIGAGILVTYKNGKIEALPQIHFNCTPFGHGQSDFSYLFMTEIAATNESLNPSVGLQLLNVLKIKTGYNMPCFSNQSFNGVTFGITLALISKKSFYQDNLKIM